MAARLKLSIVCVAVLLAACRGWGEESAAPVAQPVVAAVDPRAAQLAGQWLECWSAGPGVTEKDDLRITPMGGMTLRISRVYVRYADSDNCSGGTSWLLQEEDSEVTLQGETLLVEGLLLEKFTRTGKVTDYVNSLIHADTRVPVPYAAPLQGALGRIAGPVATLHVGDDTQPDGQGYPSALSPMVYSRQLP